MKKVILNERELLGNALERGEVSEDYNDTAGVMIRHYFFLGYDKNEVYSMVDKFMREHKDDYRSDSQYKYLKSKIDNIFKSGRFKLTNIKRLAITKKEWDAISGIESEQAARVAFILLVRVKIDMLLKGRDNPVITVNLKEVLRDASISSKEDNMFLINELTKLGLISTKTIKVNKSSGNKKYETLVSIKFVDSDSDSDIIKYIEVFDKVITYFYELYKGWKYKTCEYDKCGKRFRVSNSKKSGRPQKYCSKCIKIVDNEKRKERHKNK